MPIVPKAAREGVPRVAPQENGGDAALRGISSRKGDLPARSVAQLLDDPVHALLRDPPLLLGGTDLPQCLLDRDRPFDCRKEPPEGGDDCHLMPLQGVALITEQSASNSFRHCSSAVAISAVAIS